MKSRFQRFVSFVATCTGCTRRPSGWLRTRRLTPRPRKHNSSTKTSTRATTVSFGPSTSYFCFRADNKVLIGREKIPTMNWRDTSKNDLTKLHKSWQDWQAPGATVNLKYDNKYIWVPGPNGKDVRLTQDYTRDIFVDSRECRAAVSEKRLTLNAPVLDYFQSVLAGEGVISSSSPFWVRVRSIAPAGSSITECAGGTSTCARAGEQRPPSAPAASYRCKPHRWETA